MNYRNSMIILLASQLAIISLLVDPSTNPAVQYGRVLGIIFITADIWWPLVKDFYYMWKAMEEAERMKKAGITITRLEEE